MNEPETWTGLLPDFFRLLKWTVSTKRNMVVVLRWVVFLPAAAVAAMIGWFAVNIFGRFGLSYVDITPDSFIGQMCFTTAGSAAMAAGFVYAGLWAAPLRNKQLAYILSMIWLALNLFGLFAGVMVRNGWAIWQSVWSLVVVVMMGVMVHQGKLEV